MEKMVANFTSPLPTGRQVSSPVGEGKGEESSEEQKEDYNIK
jgi:hypothetical protein